MKRGIVGWNCVVEIASLIFGLLNTTALPCLLQYVQSLVEGHSWAYGGIRVVDTNANCEHAERAGGARGVVESCCVAALLVSYHSPSIFPLLVMAGT